MHENCRILQNYCALENDFRMIKYTPSHELSNTLFTSPFDKELDSNNRWYVLEGMVPWDSLASVMMKNLSNLGRPTVDLRYVLGALLIKGIENLSDEDTLTHISENLYMQYFVGLRSFRSERLFTPEVFVEVRKRLGEEGTRQMNEVILKYAYETKLMPQRKAHDGDASRPHRGILKIDATVSPQDITYPTDTKLLNDCREFTEQLIDYLWKSGYILRDTKPRTYREMASSYYLNFAKKKSPSKKAIKKCIKQQLQYIRRNMKHINKVLDRVIKETGSMPLMQKKDYRSWLVVQHIYEQQYTMHKDNRKKIKDRIVSLSQPWVRPIVRGKTGKKTEFGAKINASEVDGYVDFTRIDFSAYNEALDLEEILEGYKRKYGHYPEGVLVDKIYLNKKNRELLKELEINHYGPRLGRPAALSKEEKLRRKKKQNKRSEIEGKFGLGKIKYGLDKIKMRLPETSKAQMNLIAISMNMMQLLRHVSAFFVYFVTFYSLREEKALGLT